MFRFRTIILTVLCSMLLGLLSGCANFTWPNLDVVGPGFTVRVSPPSVSQPPAPQTPLPQTAVKAR
jgi:hypothetical protein